MNRIIFLLLFSVTGIAVTYYYLKPSKEKKLPILNPVDLNSEMVDPELLRIGMGHKIGEFSFKNQEGKSIALKDVKGKVFVAEYFFSTCKTICPIMNTQMQRVQRAYAGNEKVKIVSFTVDPETDTQDRLYKYAQDHGAQSDQWHFLTGNKAALYRLARRSFFVLKPAEVENQGDVGSDFIHTNNFVLVDQQLRIRGYYDGTSEKEVGNLIEDIQHLLDEK